MNTTDIVSLLALAALIKKCTDVLKYIQNRDLNGLLTQVAVWVIAIAVIVLAAHTDFASGFVFGTLPLDKVNFWSLVFIGLQAGSGAGVLFHDIPLTLSSTNVTPNYKLFPTVRGSEPVAEVAPPPPATRRRK